MARKKRRKGKPAYIVEYALARAVMAVVGALPMFVVHAISRVLGDVLYFGSPRRRGIALKNLRDAFAPEMPEERIRQIARRSCASFLLTFMEAVKIRPLLIKNPEALRDPKHTADDIFELFGRVRKIHDEAGGAIFVTPHIGNWEILPHVSSYMGIPLVVVARPPDNPYLRKLLFEDRTATGQVVIPKRNALFLLRRALRSGKSLGLLPDQSTKHGVSVDFFGHKALTTPIPAMLAITYRRPIVVVACCRSGTRFEGFVSEPIWPGQYESEKAEILRLTREMNRTMEQAIRRWPEQYLWIHNRWKTYADKGEFMAGVDDV